MSTQPLVRPATHLTAPSLSACDREPNTSSLLALALGVAVLLAAWWAGPGSAQQLGDTAFVVTVEAPAFPPGAGPRVALDEAHFNFHTADGRYAPFARLLRADGFVVESIRESFSEESLSGVDLLVIANALHSRNQEAWDLPTPSAFTADEIRSVRSWVEGGGALLLIADHMPFPGAAEDLASAFGFQVSNGFAMDTTSQEPFVFRRSDGSLANHPISNGLGPEMRVDSVASFTGEAFQAPPGAVVLLELPDGIVSLEPDVAWQFDPATTRVVDVGGWAQGAVLEVGIGRMAMFGEAAMFTAQRAGAAGAPMGMNAPVASQNPWFALNLVRWLTGVEEIGSIP